MNFELLTLNLAQAAPHNADMLLVLVPEAFKPRPAKLSTTIRARTNATQSRPFALGGALVVLAVTAILLYADQFSLTIACSRNVQ